MRFAHLAETPAPPGPGAERPALRDPGCCLTVGLAGPGLRPGGGFAVRLLCDGWGRWPEPGAQPPEQTSPITTCQIDFVDPAGTPFGDPAGTRVPLPVCGRPGW